MNSTLKYIVKKYNLDPQSDSPIFINHTRNELPKLFNELGYKIGAEVGVLWGEYSKIICESIPGTKLICIDPWEIYQDLPDGEKEDRHKLKVRRGYERTKRLLASYSCQIIKKYSMEAVKDFTSNSLDFVYIDANHVFDFIMRDIIEWSKIVRPGGIVGGHDYHCFRHPEVSFQVSTAVDTYVKVHKISPLFVFSADKSSSWFFIKNYDG